LIVQTSRFRRQLSLHQDQLIMVSFFFTIESISFHFFSSQVSFCTPHVCSAEECEFFPRLIELVVML